MKVPIIVTISASHVGHIQSVAEKLQHVGMNVSQVLDFVNAVVGMSEEHLLPELRKLDGVSSVEIEPTSEAQ